MLAVEDLAEAANSLLERHVAALDAGKLLGDREGLREESLDLARAAHDEFVFFGKLVHTHYRDNVLQFFVALKDLLHFAGRLVMLDADNIGSEYSRGRIERVDGGVNAEGRDASRKHRGGVKVRKRRGRRRVRKVVRGNVDRLNRRDGAFLGGGDTLLERAHLGRKSWLIADSGRHSPEKSRDLRARLGEAENIVDEKKDVLAFAVAEILRHGESRKTYAHSRSGRLVHLPVHKSRLRKNT